MPRKATFKINAIDELFRQLRYAPPETRRRQMNAAERLVSEIDTQRIYPESFVIYRITGYRPEASGEDAVLVGDALLADLANLVLRLSEQLSLTARDEQREALSMDEVAHQLNVAAKTVQRYRKQGLVVHSIIHEDGSRRLACFADALDRFVAQHHDRISRAAGFTRIDRDIEQQIIAKARARRAERRVSLNAVARDLSQHCGRAHETVRQLLMRHDRESDNPIFAERGPLSEREANLIYRAWRRGVTVPEMAERFGRTPATIHRAINRRRVAALASLNLKCVRLPTFDMDDADAVVLSPPIVNEQLDRVLPMHDAMELLDRAAAATPMAEHEQDTLIAAYNYLKMRAAKALARAGDAPGARDIDRIETDLRWATLLKRRLVSDTLPSAIRLVEQHLHQRLAAQPASEIRSHIALALETICDVIERADPARSHRLDRLSRYALAREMARSGVAEHHQRATVRHEPGDIALASHPQLTPWQQLLDLPEALAAHINRLNKSDRDIVIRHYGLRGSAPQTCANIAAQMNITDAAVTRLLTRALHSLRRLSRR